MKKLGFMVLLIGLMSSCGFHQSFMGSSHLTLLKEKNFEVKQEVRGTSKQVYVFGIGGLSEKSLNENAYSEMVKSAELKSNQAIVNVGGGNHTYGFFPIVFMRKTTITGQVIEFK